MTIDMLQNVTQCGLVDRQTHLFTQL